MLSAISRQGVAYYDANPQVFKAAVHGRAPVADAQRLVQTLPADSLVVDAGCGTGEDTVFLASQGLQVYAYDASTEMVRLTAENLRRCPQASSVTLRQHRHDELDLQEPAQAILASASLLFLQDEDLRTALRALARNLARGALLLASFKQGSVPRPQEDGRTYYDRTAVDLSLLADMAELEGQEVRISTDKLGRTQSWVSFMLRKPG